MRHGVREEDSGRRAPEHGGGAAGTSGWKAHLSDVDDAGREAGVLPLVAGGASARGGRISAGSGGHGACEESGGGDEPAGGAQEHARVRRGRKRERPSPEANERERGRVGWVEEGRVGRAEEGRVEAETERVWLRSISLRVNITLPIRGQVPHHSALRRRLSSGACPPRAFCFRLCFHLPPPSPSPSPSPPPPPTQSLALNTRARSSSSSFSSSKVAFPPLLVFLFRRLRGTGPSPSVKKAGGQSGATRRVHHAAGRFPRGPPVPSSNSGSAFPFFLLPPQSTLVLVVSLPHSPGKLPSRSVVIVALVVALAATSSRSIHHHPPFLLAP